MDRDCSDKEEECPLSTGESAGKATAQLLRRHEELATLHEIGVALRKLTDPTDIPELVFKAMAGRIFDTDNVYIAVYDEATGRIDFPVYTIDGKPHQQPSRKFGELGLGITEYILTNKRAVRVERDTAAELGKLGISQIGLPAESFLAVPI